MPSEMPRIIGDFDDNANALWSLHVKEAMSHDEARIRSLKDDMDGVLIFAGLFSAALTSFLVDKIHDLQVDPAQQMVYYQQQNVALLAQISNQVSAIAPQVSIPSTPPPTYVFNLNPSDVRVNAFWFMSLVFSITAALLATLVQQWVRDYMHVFQRYSNPLKSARLRQYLYEGAEGWYMPVVAESVPGLVHVSLFLFFLGLGDSLLNINTTVGVTTVVPITVCAFLYVFSMFAPVVKPQSPFRNPFSGLIWYMRQKVYPRRYLDRASGGTVKPVSSKISEGQIQLAMEENDERKDRDVRAIRWLIDNRTEDDEMESFVIAIPGAFTSKWGIDVWRKASEVTQYQDKDSVPNALTVGSQSDADFRVTVLPRHGSPPSQRTRHPLSLLHRFRRTIGIRIANGTPHDMTTRLPPRLPSNGQAPDDPYAHRDLAIDDLCKRVRHLVATCDHYSVFTNKELWHKRARGCVETVASLVLCAGIEPELFGDLGRLLHPLHQLIGTQTLSFEPGSDGLFAARLSYLCFVIVNRGTAKSDQIKLDARVAIDTLSQFGMEDGGEQANNGNVDENALRNARRIDNDFETARQICVYELRGAFRPPEVGTTEEQLREALAHNHSDNISTLERISLSVGHVANIDKAISRIPGSLGAFSSGLIRWLRGVHRDFLDLAGFNQSTRFFNPAAELRTFLPQFIFLHQRLQFLCSYSSKLRNIIDGRGNVTYQEVLESLGSLWDEFDDPKLKWSGLRKRHIMERQLWRLQDFRDGGGFGCWVELFFLISKQMLLIQLSADARDALNVGTFRAVSSNWRQHKHSIGTQRVILNLVCDIAIFDRGLLSDIFFPKYITDELLELLENIVEGQSGR
ncbi:hypothetical protein H4582DRAFT_133337 [Lactarius indigo]|nr:hypothetical protein H4582DRAFT_133337 [Lactarius indigo]